MLYAMHHCTACRSAFNLSKPSALQSSQSCFNPNYNTTQLSTTALRKGAAVCTSAANHHPTIASVEWCCQRLYPRPLRSTSACKTVVTRFLVSSPLVGERVTLSDIQQPAVRQHAGAVCHSCSSGQQFLGTPASSILPPSSNQNKVWNLLSTNHQVHTSFLWAWQSSC